MSSNIKILVVIFFKLIEDPFLSDPVDLQPQSIEIPCSTLYTNEHRQFGSVDARRSLVSQNFTVCAM